MTNYEHLKGRKYVTGKDDCYGLVRSYYKDNYRLTLANYARPYRFSFYDLDLISRNLIREGFQVIDTHLNRLEIGDGIIMAITRSTLANHVGVYVGNNYMLHHLYGSVSGIDNFDDSWKRRVLTVVRHPEVTKQNKYQKRTQINLTELLPPHVRNQFPSPVLES